MYLLSSVFRTAGYERLGNEFFCAYLFTLRAYRNKIRAFSASGCQFANLMSDKCYHMINIIVTREPAKRACFNSVIAVYKVIGDILLLLVRESGVGIKFDCYLGIVFDVFVF